MKPCTYEDILEVANIATKHFKTDGIFWAREKIYNKTNKVFIFDENLAINLELIGTYKYSMHLIGGTRDLKRCKDFIIDICSWVFDNTPTTCIIAFAGESNKRLQMAIGSAGIKRVGVIPDAGGREDEILYVYPIKDRIEIESRRSKCHKQ